MIKNGSSKAIRIQDLKKKEKKKGDDKHVLLMANMCNVKKRLLFKRKNQRHVRGRGLVAPRVQPDAAWHFVAGRQNKHGRLESSHSTRQQLPADSVLNRQESLVNYCNARIRFSILPLFQPSLFVMKHIKCVPSHYMKMRTTLGSSYSRSVLYFKVWK